jgi:aryl-alcohol dehydrogenase-like predicted oxidoreductase
MGLQWPCSGSTSASLGVSLGVMGVIGGVGWHKRVSAIAIALAYVLCQPFPTFALVDPHTLEEIRSSCDALRVSLTPEELHGLNLE